MIIVPILNMDGTPAVGEFGVARTKLMEDKTVGGAALMEHIKDVLVIWQWGYGVNKSIL